MRRPQNQANALKHGVFAKMTILPWEDANEFKQLHAALIDEWKPVGPTEHDAVFSLAKAMWRKRRMQFFMHIERMRVSVEPNHEAYDEAKTLRGLSAYIEAEPDGVDRALTLLLPDRIAEHLRQTLPRASFQSVSKWVHAIQKEIALVLLPAAERFEGFDMMINRDVGFFTHKVIKDELAVEDRIDAMIERAIKRLAQTKAMKQMLGTTSASAESDQPKKLLSNKPNESAEIVIKKQNGRRAGGTREAAMRTLDRRNSKPYESM
jgi:hypothetical protein